MTDIIDVINQEDTRIGYFQLEHVAMMETREQEVRTKLIELIQTNQIICKENLLIDVHSLTKLVNLDCTNCHKILENGCCGGSPLHFPAKSMINIFDNIDNIIEGRFSEEQKSIMKKEGIFERFMKVLLVPKNTKWGCVFLMETNEGVKRCAIKDWCLCNDKEITEFCSTSCLIFPLEIMQLKSANGEDYYCITSTLNEDFTSKYSRWGNLSTVKYPCLSYDNVPEQYKGQIFKKEEYVPIYIVFKELIEKWFGIDTYKTIEEECEKSQRKKESIDNI